MNEVYNAILKVTKGKKSAFVMLIVFIVAGLTAMGKVDTETFAKWSSWFEPKPLDIALVVGLGHKVVRWMNTFFKTE